MSIVMRPSRKTPNTLRWEAHVEKDKKDFELYIPKWRVPKPWPGRIRVRISPHHGEDLEVPDRNTYTLESLREPISALVTPTKDHVNTRQYEPSGDREDWQIGFPYIPYSLIPPGSDLLVIQVEWDLDSCGEFINVPTYGEDPDDGQEEY